MNRKRRSTGALVVRGLAAGLAGGLVASFAMNQFQASLSKLSRAEESGGQGGDDATVKVAEAVSDAALGHHLTRSEKEKAGPAVHYAFGATMGALYGVVSELEPRVKAGYGIPFGAGLWLAADELAVPALGLSKAPIDYPVSTHASAFAAHLVYGVTVDLVRRIVGAVLDA